MMFVWLDILLFRKINSQIRKWIKEGFKNVIRRVDKVRGVEIKLLTNLK